MSLSPTCGRRRRAAIFGARPPTASVSGVCPSPASCLGFCPSTAPVCPRCLSPAYVPGVHPLSVSVPSVRPSLAYGRPHHCSLVCVPPCPPSSASACPRCQFIPGVRRMFLACTCSLYKSAACVHPCGASVSGMRLSPAFICPWRLSPVCVPPRPTSPVPTRPWHQFVLGVRLWRMSPLCSPAPRQGMGTAPSWYRHGRRPARGTTTVQPSLAHGDTVRTSLVHSAAAKTRPDHGGASRREHRHGRAPARGQCVRKCGH